MKRFSAVILTAVLTLGIGTDIWAAHWVEEGLSHKYVEDNGSYATDIWMGIEGKIYHFDKDGNYDAVNKYVYRYDAPFDGYDTQYPLKGMLEPYGLNQVVTVKTKGSDTVLSVDIRKDGKYGRYNTSRNSSSALIAEFAQALSGKYWNERGVLEQMKDGFIDGQPITLYRDLPVANEAVYEETKVLLDEVRNFLNSFDFKNASEYEKAQRISQKILEASYDNEAVDNYNKGNIYYAGNWINQSPYGCLVTKKCVCAGYTSTFQLLGRLVGLECLPVSEDTHGWNYVKLDGEWWIVSNGSLYAPGEQVYVKDRVLPSLQEFFGAYEDTSPDSPGVWDIETGIVTNIYINETVD